MKPFRQICTLIFLAAIATVPSSALVAQQNPGERAVIEIVQINHRDPGRVREAISASLDPRGSIGQIDDKLIIATTAANLNQLSEMIVEVDVPPGRIVISVDFAFLSGDADSTSRHQSQAIEGEELVFVVSSTPAGTGLLDAQSEDSQTEPDTANSVNAVEYTHSPRIIVAAEIIDEAAEINLSVENIPGLVGSHILRIVLGEWQVINTPVTNTDAEPQPIATTVAVRVDRVP